MNRILGLRIDNSEELKRHELIKEQLAEQKSQTLNIEATIDKRFSILEHRVERCEKDIQNLDSRYAKIPWVLIGIGVSVIGVAFGVLRKYVSSG